MIRIKEEIAVPSPPARVWEVVSDPAQVVACIPGAELGESHEDGSFDGTLVVKFAAVRVKFGARVLLELDEHARAGRLSSAGKDGQGATRFKTHATFRISEQPAGSLMSVLGEVTLTGKLAALVESGAGAVVARMTRDFSVELVRRCAGEQADAPADVVTPVRRGWWARVRDWWRRGVHKGHSEQKGVACGTAE